MNAYLLANNGGAVFGIIAGIIVLIILIYLGVTCIKIVRQSDAVIVERLGAYNRTLSHGLHLLTPIIEKAVHTISLKERVCDFSACNFNRLVIIRFYSFKSILRVFAIFNVKINGYIDYWTI